MHAIEMSTTGGPEVLEWCEVDEPVAGPGRIVVEVAAAGVNYIDTYQRTGLYPVALPYIPGLEGAGSVTEVGDGVTQVAVGDTVAWCTQPGSYAERVSLDPGAVALVPNAVSADIAAAVMLQGMTAHYLAIDTYPLQPDDRCLVHAGAGGVGLLLIQIAKLRGAEVFTTVGTPEKAELAAAAGADHTILYRDVDFGAEVERIAGERALDVVYDGVGQSVFRRSLDLLRPRGVMASFGNASGPPEPIAPLELAPSLYLTRPSLFHYVMAPGEFQRRADDLFAWIASDQLDVRIGETHPLAHAAEAHRRLEGRATTGKVLLRA